MERVQVYPDSKLLQFIWMKESTGYKVSSYICWLVLEALTEEEGGRA